jgi:hypothetical protein
VIVTLPLKTQAQQDTGQSVKETTAERLARSA